MPFNQEKSGEYRRWPRCGFYFKDHQSAQSIRSITEVWQSLSLKFLKITRLLYYYMFNHRYHRYNVWWTTMIKHVLYKSIYIEFFRLFLPSMYSTIKVSNYIVWSLIGNRTLESIECTIIIRLCALFQRAMILATILLPRISILSNFMKSINK